MSKLMFMREWRISNEQELVRIRLGKSVDVTLWYPHAIHLSGGIRLAAKMAMREEGMKVSEWHQLAGSDEELPPINVNHRPRRSSAQPNCTRYKAGWDGPLVVVRFDDTAFRLHWKDALSINTILRHYAKQAKGWAGDSSSGFVVHAHLSDAEKDYRRGFI